MIFSVALQNKTAVDCLLTLLQGSRKPEENVTEQPSYQDPLTSCIHDSQHDGGDQRDLAAGGVEDHLDLFEKHCD